MFFDPTFYKNIYPDLVSMTDNELQQHYRDAGIAEGRVGSEHQLKQFISDLPYTFDYKYYQRYPDVPGDIIGCMVHFYMHGNREGRIYNLDQLCEMDSDLEETIEQEKYLYTNDDVNVGINKKINILVRTHNREEMFKACMDSIRRQLYKNYHVYISAQTDEDRRYVDNYINSKDIQKHFSVVLGRSCPGEYHYNNFCNQLIYQVNDGWLMFLDDDDQLTNQYALGYIARHLDTDVMVLWKYKRPDKLIYPDVNEPLTQPGTIASTSYCIHHNVAKQSAWPRRRAGDYYYIEPIYNSISKVMIDRILVKYQLSSQTASFGRSDDIYNYK